VAFNATGRLLIIYSAFAKYLKKWEYNEEVHQLFINFKKAYDSVRREVLHKILIEFGIPMKLLRLIKMSLTETYSRVRVGKNVSDRFPMKNGLKQGDALSPMLLNFALEYAMRRFQVIEDGLKLNGTHQLLAYVHDANILGGSIHTLKENAEASVAVTREIGLEVSAHGHVSRSECRTNSQCED